MPNPETANKERGRLEIKWQWAQECIASTVSIGLQQRQTRISRINKRKRQYGLPYNKERTIGYHKKLSFGKVWGTDIIKTNRQAQTQLVCQIRRSVNYSIYQVACTPEIWSHRLVCPVHRRWDKLYSNVYHELCSRECVNMAFLWDLL